MNFLYRIYFALPRFDRFGLPGKAINRILGLALKYTLDAFVPKMLMKTAESHKSGLNKDSCDESYIVSLTSFPARINEIWICLEIMLRQTFKPDKIILWLSAEQFPNLEKDLPENVMKLTKRGITIKFVEDDIRSHKKYLYAMEKYPGANIITLDDDLYYDKYILENLVDLHRQHPELIVTNRAHKITFFSDGKIKPYRKWEHNVIDKNPSYLLFPTGGAGTLYPPDSLYKDALNISLIKQLCFHADDIWLKMMGFLNKTNVVTNGRYNKDFVSIKSSQIEKLVQTNVISGGNDEQLKNVCDYYKIDVSKFQ